MLFCGVVILASAEDAKTDLEGAESQSFGYGYGTKVQDAHSVATGKTIDIVLIDSKVSF